MPLSVEDGKRLIEVEASCDDCEQGSASATPATDWTFQRVEDRINAEEAKYPNIPRGLAKAVGWQESRYNPDAEGDGGQARSIFQLHAGAAKDVGIDPAKRGDPDLSIQGGVKYLSMKIAQAKGDIPTALSLYNWGTPDYRGIGDPHYIQNVARHYTPPEGDKPSWVARLGRAISPASAEAATPPPQGGSRLEAVEAEIARREAIEAERAKREAQQAPGTTPPPAPATAPAARPAPPTATSTPAQDAAYRDWAAQQAPGGTQAPAQPQTPGAPHVAPGGRQGAPAPNGEPPSDLVIDIEKPSSDVTTMPGAIQAIEPLTPRGAEAVQGRVHEQGIPLSAVPAIAVNTLGTVGGAALGAPLGPLGSAAGAALGGSLATRANTALGLSPQEKPLLETPWANVYPSDLLGAIPLGVAGATSALKGTVRNLPGANVAKHEIAAERLADLGRRTAPAVPSDVLWQKAGQSNTPIATADVWRTAGDVVRRKSRTPNLSADDPALKAAQDLLSLAKKHGGPVPIHELDDARRNLVPHMRDPDVKRLYGAVLGDMDNAVARGVPGAADLRGAIATTRKEHAHTELTDLWSDGKGMQKTSGDVTQVYGKRIRNQFENRLREDKTLAGAFTPEELADIRGTLREVSRLTRITNPEAQGTVGSTLKWLGRLGGAGYGATSGDLLTGGMMILATEGASAVMARAMQSPVGRWAVREAIREGNGRMTHGSLSAIAALVAREAAPDAPAPAPTP